MKKTKMSKRTMALLTAAVMLLLIGTAGTTYAGLTYRSQTYEAEFYMNHLQVHLIENGEDVCGGENTLDGTAKVTGQLATDLGYSKDSNGDTLGKAEPGRVYKEEIAAENGQDIDEFVRMTVRKYWVKTDKDGNVIMDDATGIPEKDTRLSPDLIRLTYGKDREGKAYDLYNKDAWARNDEETTEESATYYLREALPGSGDEDSVSALLFDRIMIDGQVARLGNVSETKEGGYTVYTYEYEYDGTAFFVEAEVQAIQTHNANEAIGSQWCVSNVTASGSSLSVD